MKTAFVAMLILIGSVASAETAPQGQPVNHAATAPVVSPQLSTQVSPPLNDSKKSACETPSADSRSAVGSPSSLPAY